MAGRRITGVLLAVTVIAGCGRGVNDSRPEPPATDNGNGQVAGNRVDGFTVRTLATGLDTPWDLAWGPDGHIWVSEREGAISRVNAGTGAVTEVGRIDAFELSESGLMGIAFHPDFESRPFVYAVYSYSTGSGVRNRLVRMRYDGAALGAPELLLNAIPGAPNHDGSRLAVGPDDLLYLTTGDAQSPALSQNLNSLAGKVLRLDLEGAPAQDNPFGTAVYSFGHRNPQGLVFHPSSGRLYSTEHGPLDNDEVNLIVRGGNYGWPGVRGYCDNDVLTGESEFCAANNVVEPLAAWTPTIAPAGADLYTEDLIPAWRGSLLFTTLKGQALWRIGLSSDGMRATSRENLFNGRFGRLRDVLVGPEGEVYLATSNRDGRGQPRTDDDRILVITP
ncbi:MAG: PQQ-dependent sugar dehydrogenase [Candidatus Latescibacteria bacterium]|nr:PQQ-dependent sugar dehydrogenase [Candidatus Latescibacterota bacterium]